ncbi:MAG: (2Fe-2S)-binding protein [Acidimicrobiales bacterium]
MGGETVTAGDLETVLGAVASRVGYLRAETSVQGPEWVGCDELIGDPTVMDTALEASLAALGTDDMAVAASIFAQSYAFRVAAAPLGAYALGLPIPPAAPAAVAVRLTGGRASGAGFRSACLRRSGDTAGLADELVVGHLTGFVDAVRRRVRVGTRLLWGNAAASCAAVFRALEGAACERGEAAERQAIRRRADAFFACAPQLGRAGLFESVAAEGTEGWYWTRRSCCLWFQISGGRTCEGCSLTTADDRAAHRLAELRRRP